MFIPFVLWLCFGLLSQNDILILKNGKNLPCDEYTVVKGRVTILTNGQTFSIPEKLVDWEASESAKQALDKQREAERKAAEVKKPPPPKRGPITLTTRDLKDKPERIKSGPVTVNFKKSNNSIVVAMTVNGKGPFDFILDTGAAITCIDPEVLRLADIKPKIESIQLVGVSGRTIHALRCEVPKISLSGATVHQLEAASYRISSLYQQGFYGLIGQDFLNHFIVNIDATTNLLKLTPIGSSSGDGTRGNSSKYDIRDTIFRLRRVNTMLEEHGDPFNFELSVEERESIITKLNEANDILIGVKNQISHQRDRLQSEISAKTAKPHHARKVQLFNCLEKGESYRQTLSEFIQISITNMRSEEYSLLSENSPKVKEKWPEFEKLTRTLVYKLKDVSIAFEAWEKCYMLLL